jgi:hypothetical protein
MKTLTKDEENELTLRQAQEFLEERRGLCGLAMKEFVMFENRVHAFERRVNHGIIAG